MSETGSPPSGQPPGDLVANARLVERLEVAQDLFVLRLAPEGWTLPDFAPGQHLTLGVPGLKDDKGRPVKRVYSIASPPGLDHVELYVTVVDDGKLTTPLSRLGIGDGLWIDQRIYGTFTLDPVPADHDIVLVATGTGLAPFVSMARHFSGKGRWRRLVIVHGARLVAELGYRELLTDLSAADPTITYIPTVTREPEDSGWDGLRGRVQAVFEGDVFPSRVGSPLDPGRTHMFLCGNPAMVDAMEALLTPLDFRKHSKREPGNLHFERWW